MKHKAIDFTWLLTNEQELANIAVQLAHS